MSRPAFTSQSLAQGHPDQTAGRISDPTAVGVGVEGPCAPDHHRY
jgi:S-adenosylmethionine synthetase